MSFSLSIILKFVLHEFLIDKMDLSNVDLDFSFEVIQSPIKTAAAKVPLLIKN